MNGFDRLKEQIRGQEDKALIQTVDYLLTRDDMQEKYLNEEKNINEMAKFIREKGMKYLKNGWNYVTNEVVYAWAVMYFSFPNSFLKIEKEKSNKNTTVKQVTTKNNVIQLEQAKQKLEEKKEVQQISLFGGAI